MPRILSLLAVCAWAAWWPSAADACTCARRGSACEEFSRADAIFVGRVISIQQTTDAPKFGTRRVEIAVVDALRGVKPGTVVVRTYPADGASCGYPFSQGETYLVYAFEPEPGVLVTTSCARTRVASEVPEEIAYLRTLSKPAPGSTARVNGFVQTLAWPPPPASAPPPLLRTRLTAAGATGTYRATSSDSGEFSFEALPLGRYELKAEVPSQFEAETKTLDVVHGESCSVTYVTIWHAGRVSGRIVGRDGAPIADLALELLRADAPPSSEAFIATRTGDEGAFEFRRVPPGEFTLRVARGAVADRAGRISVGEGGHVRLEDVMLPAPVETVTIEGVAVRANGMPAAGAAVSVRSSGQAGLTLPVTTAEDGSFKITVLAGKTYQIQATRSTFQGKRLVGLESGETALRPGSAAPRVRIVLKPR